MRKISVFIPVLLLFSQFAISSNQCQGNSKGNCCKKNSCAASATDFKSKQTEFSNSDSTGLMLMREEEKMAHDIYVAFNEKYNRRVFNNISQSETMHMNAVLSLINHFELVDPLLPQVGKFRNEQIQILYDKLIAQGTDLVGALKAGAYVEEFDIIDLKKCIENTQNEDLKAVYSNLLFASERHLNAFVRNLSANGIKYKPQLMSDNEYMITIK